MRFTYEGIFSKRPDGSYTVDFPDLPGCTSFGDDLDDAIEMGADMLESFLSISLTEGVELPRPELRHIDEPQRFSILVSVDVDPADDVPVRTTAEAAEMLGVSTSRVRQMISAGILERRKEGRDNLVTLESIERRLDHPRHSGRPKKRSAQPDSPQ
ncbi:MAG: type II toxin-antitoxin system HicB family antitoxin [Coriobacteriales bacterium]|nr:type II toxin-antitoxin system HicB family antitoxin [Coriobacteriales bacterium]